MQSEAYRKIETQYDYKRQQAQKDARMYKQNVYDENPRLAEIEDEIARETIKTMKANMNLDDVAKQVEQEKLEFKVKLLQEEYDKELKKLGLTKQDFEPKYECEKCSDTGMCGDKLCSCFKQALINESFKQSNMLKIKDENFETFDFGFYSSTPDKEKYGIDKSPLEKMDSIRKQAYEFSHNLDNPSQKNLLFSGKTGLGKTFLANCIANKAIKQGKSVIYQTAPILLDKMVDYQFKFNKTPEEREEYEKIFDVDLLIIDDLGAETMNAPKFSELFSIINTRALKNKKMVISTNLTTQDIKNIYEERIFSRIVGDFTIHRFIGEDIRILKKRINK